MFCCGSSGDVLLRCIVFLYPQPSAAQNSSIWVSSTHTHHTQCINHVHILSHSAQCDIYVNKLKSVLDMRARLKALPPSPHNTITVAQDKSHEKNVCLKRRTEFMIASCGDLSTHFNAKTILRHTSILGSCWTPRPYSLKAMPLHFNDPWHLLQSKTNSSVRTLAAH